MLGASVISRHPERFVLTSRPALQRERIRVPASKGPGLRYDYGGHAASSR
jgi:hypothetical protein